MENAHYIGGTNRGELPVNLHGDTGDNQGKPNNTNKWCKLKDVPVHGDTLEGKQSNVIRLMFENVDGFVIPNRQNLRDKGKHNYKQAYLSNLFSRLDIDLFGAAETRQQFGLLPHELSLSKQMDLREGTQCQTSHNVHERFGKIQQGGTCMIANDSIAQYVNEGE